MNDYFYEMSIQDNIPASLKKEIESTNWFESNGFSILKLQDTFFKNRKLFDLITRFNAAPLIFKMELLT
jgi:hypothetical protein